MYVLQYFLAVSFCVHIYGQKSSQQHEEETINGPSTFGFHSSESLSEWLTEQNETAIVSSNHSAQHRQETSMEFYEGGHTPKLGGQKTDQHEEETINGHSAFGFPSYESAGEFLNEQNKGSVPNSYPNFQQFSVQPYETGLKSNLKITTIEKRIPVPYPITFEKKIAYKEEVPVDKPYPLPVPKPYPVIAEKKVPFEAKVHVPVPYIIEKKIPYKVEIPVNKPYQVSVPKPYNVYIEKKIPLTEVKYVPFEVKVPVDKPYPIHVPVVKHIPYTVEKRIPIEVKLPVDKPYTVDVLKPYKVIVEKKVPFILEKYVPYEVKVPIKVAVPIVKHVPIIVPNEAKH